MNLTQTTSTNTGSRIYVDDEGFKYVSASTLAGFFFSTYPIYCWAVKLGKQIAANLGLENLTKRELYELGKPEGDRICNEAAERGSAIHSAIETSSSTGNPDYDKFVDQYNQNIAPYLEIRHQELTLAYISPEGMRVAGKADIIGAWRGVVGICDMKTSESAKEPEHMGRFSLQMSAYSLAYHQSHGIETHEGFIFNLLPDSTRVLRIPLEEPKRMLLETVLPNFYEYYREYGHVDKRDRPFPNQYRDMGNVLSRFEKQLAATITVE